jgi:hypothetical protein
MTNLGLLQSDDEEYFNRFLKFNRIFDFSQLQFLLTR